MKGISTVYLESENVLDTEAIEDFSRHIDVDPSARNIEFTVIKYVSQSQKISNAIQFAMNYLR